MGSIEETVVNTLHITDVIQHPSATNGHFIYISFSVAGYRMKLIMRYNNSITKSYLPMYVTHDFDREQGHTGDDTCLLCKGPDYRDCGFFHDADMIDALFQRLIQEKSIRLEWVFLQHASWRKDDES